MNRSEVRKELVDLYQASSKHSNYQVLPDILQPEIGKDVSVRTRYERERLQYILDNLQVEDRTILDIGGNTGYFTFELIGRGAALHYCEGNEAHARFVKLAADYLGLSDKLAVDNSYFNFDKIYGDYDIVLLLNVLHHVGDDFGDKDITLQKARERIIEALVRLSCHTSYLVFQLGYNWKGNRDICLFQEGTKREMIDFVLGGTKGCYEVEKIGIPEMRGGSVSYADLNEKNIARDDSLGEFLNRPLFILKSKVK